MTNPQKVNAYTIVAVVFMVCFTVAAVEIPTDRWEKFGRWLTDPATAVAVTALGAAIAAIVMRFRHSPVPALVLAFVASSALVGCGASAIRTHAVTAHELHGAIEVAGDAIEQGTALALAQCPSDAGAERDQCIDRVEHEVVAAAALRDAMIAPADAYRADVLAQCPDVDTCAEPSDDIMAQLAAAALAAFHDAPALVAALRALGLPIPGGLLGGP